jgi:hypothetical protein
MQIIAARPQCSGGKSFGCVFSTQRTHTPPPQLFAIAHLCSFVGHRRHNCHNSMYASVVTIHSSFSTFPLLDSSALSIKQQKSFPFLYKAVKDDDPSVYSDVCNISGQKCWFKQDHLSCARKRPRRPPRETCLQQEGEPKGDVAFFWHYMSKQTSLSVEQLGNEVKLPISERRKE